MPSLDHIQIETRNPCVIIQSEDGQIIGTYGDRFEDMTRVQNLPPYVAKALISVEDHRFYSHFGIDFLGLFRALYKNFHANRIVQGGSTLTQQLAKNILFSQGTFEQKDRSLKRKVQELIMAFWLEWKFTKDEILTLYLNRVDFGGGTFGIDAAARKFFNKPASELSLFESAVLTGLLRATSAYSPVRSPKKAIERAKFVLERMKQEGVISNIQPYLNQGAYDLLTYHGEHKKAIQYKYFADWIYSQVENFVGAIDQDLVIVTTLNTETQKRCEEAVDSQYQKMAKDLRVSEAGMVVLSFDGAVIAMRGGINYERSQFNRVTQAVRPTGSAFKPIVYLAALESGMTPDTLIDDSPYTKMIGNRVWKPSNFHWQSQGQIALKYAFAKSVNAVSIRLTEQTTPEVIVEVARRLGITRPLKPDLSIALGTAEATLLEMATVFATFANGGKSVWPYGITEIRNKEGKILYMKEDHKEKTIVEPKIAAIMQYLLRLVVSEGTGRAANVNSDISGKSGSNANKDAWFFGYNKSETIGVWVGNDDNSPMDKKSVGGRLPARIAAEFFKSAPKTSFF